MNLVPAAVQALYRDVLPKPPVWPAEMSPWHDRPAALLGMIAIWRERMRFRWKLERLARETPHLVDDIGLTRRQVEAEIAKRFWQA